MKRMTIAAVGLALAAALPATPAAALSARTFVSGHGNDANPCNFAGPCRTFAAAYAKTAPSGEITVLDVAGYGPLTITTALSIVNDGVGEAGVILIAAGNAITITAGPSDAVSLRGLTLDASGLSLTVANCVIRHFAGDGINFFPNASSNLAVSNTVAADNGGHGIYVLPGGSGTVTAVFNRVEANNNAQSGILVDGSTSTGTVNTTVSESVAAHNNAGAGFSAATAAGHASNTLTVFHSVSASNSFGIAVTGPGATVRLAQSVVAGNGAGWFVFTSGVVASYGDNYIDGNGSNTGSLSTVAKQ